MSRWLARTEFDTWTGQWLRRIRRRHNEQCINVVAYHGISPRDSIFTTGTTLRHDPTEFERQMDYLADNFNLMSLEAMVDAMERGESLRRAVAVTIDDGMADSASFAVPILVRRRIPATLFVVTSVVGNEDLMWQHKLTWLQSQGLGEKVVEAMAAEGFPPILESQSVDEYARQHYRADLPEILETLIRATGSTGPAIAAKARPYIEREDLASFDPELIQIGNHTYSHAILANLDEAAQRIELQTARDAIRDLTGRTPFAVAYPFGLKRHFNAISRRLVAETGHRAAVDMRRRLNLPGVDAFNISRKPAPCGSQQQFEQAIEDWPDNAAIDSTNSETR